MLKLNNSNCTLTLRNDRGQFKEGNAAGFFGTGKVIKNSKVRIIAGTVSDDGTENPEYVFTGFINAEPVYDLDERVAAITIYDHMAAFEETSAENLSTLVENALLGSDSGTAFNTTTDKVGLLLEVRRGPTSGGPAGAAKLNPSADYSVSGLNQIGPGATITLNEALTSGESVWATWRWWHQNKEIHWIVSQLCDLAGITNKAISPVIFSGNLESTVSYDTQGQWKTGTFVFSDADSYPGSVCISKIALINKTFSAWGGGGLSSNWTIYPHGSRFDVLYGQILTGEPAVYAGSSDAAGTWDLEISGNYYVCPFFYFLASSGSYSAAQGYAFGRARDDGKWKLWRMNGEGGTIIWSSGLGTPGGSDTMRVRIVRKTGGVFYIALYNLSTGALVAGSMSAPAVTDNTYATANSIITRYSLASTGGLARYGYIKNIRYSSNLATGGDEYEPWGNWTSPAIDGGADFKSWGLLSISSNVPSGCTISIVTREKANAGDAWSEWSYLGASGQIQATKRYLQIYWIAFSNAEQSLTPIIYSLIVPYYTSTTEITLVNMTGLTAKEALDQLSQLSCYEMGFDSNDTFIFRPRTTQLSSVKTLDRGNIEKLSTLSDGADRVYNRINVSFGQYNVVSDPESEGESAPTSRDKFGVRELQISSASLLPAENVNLAKALAPTVYAYTSKAKRRATVDAKFDLALELGDRVTVNYSQEDIFRMWRWGDANAGYGREDLKYYSAGTLPGALMLAGADMRVEGIEFDLENWRTRYDLVEVL